MSWKLDAYEFDIEVTPGGRMPSQYLKAILPAVKATLVVIPRKVLQAKLDKGVPYTLSVALVTAPQIQKLNAQYRHKDRPTDVLSFSRLEPAERAFPGPADIGEVLICWRVALAQARSLGVPPAEELQRLTVHGVLHLFGYDHEISPAEERRMFRLQDKALDRL